MLNRFTCAVVIATAGLTAGCSSLPAPAPAPAPTSGTPVPATAAAPPAGVGAGTASATATGACFDPVAGAHPGRAAAPRPAPTTSCSPTTHCWCSRRIPTTSRSASAASRATYRAQGKPVTRARGHRRRRLLRGVPVVEEQLGARADVHGDELSNLATPEVDSFAEVRRGESVAAAARARPRRADASSAIPTPGSPPPGATARRASSTSRCAAPTSRAARDCETCNGGYGEGAGDRAHRRHARQRRCASASPPPAPRTLIATTHWLDGHGDHAALGKLVRQIDGELAQPRAGGLRRHPRPHAQGHRAPGLLVPGAARRSPARAPTSEACATADADWVARLAQHRFHPDWPAALPDDADYGEERQLCLAPRAVAGRVGDEARGRALVRFAARHGGAPGEPPAGPVGDHGLQRLPRLLRAAHRGVRARA